jgi:hypothetical protein
MNTLAILIPSCDKYSDLWPPFFHLFRRHWSDCPYPVYLGVNNLTFKQPNVKILTSSHGIVWADSVLDFLECIPEQHVLLWLEDFFLRRPVSSQKIAKVYDDFVAMEANMIRLVRRPGPKTLLPSSYLGVVEPGSEYRVSTQATIWRKDILTSLIVKGESIWQFEVNGSRRSDNIHDGFYAVQQDLIPYRHHVVERGKWFPWEALRFGMMNIGCDFSRRPVMSVREACIWLSWKSISLLLSSLPQSIRFRILGTARRIKHYGK